MNLKHKMRCKHKTSDEDGEGQKTAYQQITKYLCWPIDSRSRRKNADGINNAPHCAQAYISNGRPIKSTSIAAEWILQHFFFSWS